MSEHDALLSIEDESTPSSDVLAVESPTTETAPLINWPIVRSRIFYYIPILGWSRKYNRQFAKSDLVAAISVSCVLIPQSLSFAGALVRIPPIYGLYASTIPLLTYALLGTSKQLAMGPEALVSILTGTTISEYLKQKRQDPITLTDNRIEDLQEAIDLSTLMAFLVGIFTFLLGFFRLGFLESVLSRSLLRGFINAVALVVVIELGEKLLGFHLETSTGESPFQILLSLISNIGKTHVPTLLLSVFSIAFILISKKVKDTMRSPIVKMIPEVLVLVVFTTCMSAYFKWDEIGIAILKDVQGGMIPPSLPKLSVEKVNSVFLSATLISLIGYVESVAVAKLYATKHSYNISPNRELVALGFSNMAGSLFGSWPVFGSLGRSSINDASGAQTQMAGLLTSLVILLSTFFLLPMLYYLPKAVCASIIVSAAVKLIEMEEVYFILKLNAWRDLSLLLLTFSSTIFMSIEIGVLLSVGFSLLLVVKYSTKPKISILGRTVVLDKFGNQKEKFKSTAEFKEAEQIPGILIVRFDESLYFGNCSYLKERLDRVEKFGSLAVHPADQRESFVGQETKDVIFDFSSCISIDASACQSLFAIFHDYRKRAIRISCVRVSQMCLDAMEKSGLTNQVESRFFNKIHDALAMQNKS